jgi:pimeloyl-ACP methyl ester carboxylesterase
MVDAATPATGGLSHFEPAECRFQMPPGKTVTCGYLIVPEDRSQKASGDPPHFNRLHVAVVKSTDGTPAPDPLLYLAGGPGGHALEDLPWIARDFDSVLKHRDLVLFDQRGVGLSEPSLDCPEVAEFVAQALVQNPGPDEEIRQGVEAYRACRQRLLQEGINLSAYTSAASAADVNDLRLALGYDEWNLYGISYGTRLALTVMRDYPVGLRSVILDSIYPPQADSLVEDAVNTERAFKLLFRRCAADEGCSAAFPDLETVFFDLAAQLDAEPITVPFQSTWVPVNGDDLIGIVREVLFDSDAIPGLPKLIFDVLEGTYYDFSRWLSRNVSQLEYLSEGMNASVECAEEIPFSRLQAVGATNAGIAPGLRGYFDTLVAGRLALCDAWNVNAAAGTENEPVISELPTLLLAGDTDPATPPAWAQLASQTLSNAHYVEFPGVGHGVYFARRCARHIVDDFLETPMASPDTGCVAELRIGFILR